MNSKKCPKREHGSGAVWCEPETLDSESPADQSQDVSGHVDPETLAALEKLWPKPNEDRFPWRDVDAELQPVELCLNAAVEGLEEVLESVGGTVVGDMVEGVQEIIRAVLWRL